MCLYLYSFKSKILIPVTRIEYIKETDRGTHIYLITNQEEESFVEERPESWEQMLYALNIRKTLEN